MPDLRVIISGGGTGGHIFPAIAIANAVKKINPTTEFLFVGAKGKMEMEKVPASGYKIVGLWISGIQRSLKPSNLMFPFKVVSSLAKALKIVLKFKPHVAIGVGGYASGPLLYAANLSNIPTLIQEQNSYPGITNRILAKRANKICVAYDNLSAYFPKEKLLLTGNPVRENVIDIEGKKVEGLQHFGISDEKATVLIVGGSQGAMSINIAIDEGVKTLLETDVQVIWQCGKHYYSQAVQSVEALNATGNIKVHEFIQKMDLAYAVADVVVSRAGASTVSELCLIGKPAILVPLPSAAEDHQTKNCIELVKKEAAILVKDKESKEKLIDELLNLLKDDDKKKSLSQNIVKLALRDSADKIAKEVLLLANLN